MKWHVPSNKLIHILDATSDWNQVRIIWNKKQFSICDKGEDIYGEA